MGRTKKVKGTLMNVLSEQFEVSSNNKAVVVEQLNNGTVVDIHKVEEKDKLRDYLYSVFNERLLSREVDSNDIIRYNNGEACANEIFRVVEVEKTDYITFDKVMKTRAADKEKSAILGYIVLKGNRKSDKGREIDSRTYRVSSNFILYNKEGERKFIIARDGRSTIQASDIRDFIKKDEIDFCYFIGEGNIVINEDLFKIAEEVEETDVSVDEEEEAVENEEDVIKRGEDIDEEEEETNDIGVDE